MSGNGKRNEAHAGLSYCVGRNARGRKRKSWTAIFGMASKHRIGDRRLTPGYPFTIFIYLNTLIPLSRIPPL